MTQPILPAVADVQQLAPQGQLETPLTDTTPVLCIHRGRRARLADGSFELHPQAARHKDGSREPYYVGDYKDTYNSDHYVIAPGYFSVEYGCAQHFQKRAVVPGSRNPETGFQASFIAIIGIVEGQPGGGYRVVRPVDPTEDWPPFTEDECREYALAGDAINRAEMVNPIERDVTVMSVNERLTGMPQAAPSRVSQSGGAKKSGRSTQIEATDPSVMTPIPAEENRTVRQIKADQAKKDAGED